jgi:outer membrane protein
MKNLLRILAMGALAGVAAAQAPPPEGDPVVTTVAPAPVAPMPPPRTEKSWRLGLAFGYGERTNPLVQSDDIPVIVDVDIAWFGKRWFFDNFDLGFALLDTPRFTTNLVARVNSDRAFFSKTNTRFVTFGQSGGALGGVDVPEPPGFGPDPPPAPIEVKPPKRDYAVEAGVEVLFDGGWGNASVRAFHDVSNTHEGYEISADYGYRLTRGRLSVAPTVGVAYKSASLNDYYWGVHADEANRARPEYHANGGVSWQAGLQANYYLTKSIRLAMAANYERLEDSVASSPLVEEPDVIGYFAGCAWTF